MALACCMTGCTVAPAQDVYYFPLPTKPALRRRWLAVIKPHSKLGAGASVCSRHFATTDYETVRGRTRLKRDKVPMDVDQKTQTTDDQSNESNDSESKSDETDATKDKDSNNIEEKSKDSGKETGNVENGTGDERESETGDELGDKVDSEGGKEMEDTIDTKTNGMNGTEESHDTNAVEIQITPDIIEDYNPIHVTPDITEDYDILKPSTEHDIEDILTNYHILHPPERRTQLDAPTTDEKAAEKPSEKPPVTEKPSEKPAQDTVHTIEDDDDLPLGQSSAPVFIEIPVDKGRGKGSEERDCLMVLESLQVSIDPACLMLPDEDRVEQIDLDDKSEHDSERDYDPISLLTSSDEDDVIIEEPHIDTVEVSDETDEDDVPLVRLVKSEKTGHSLPTDIAKIFWGAQEYYCSTCNYCTCNNTQYKNHLKTHSGTAIQICQVCGFTTASEYQFSRHKKKHKDDKRYKCHLCDYKARHNMSLIYHLKTHKEGATEARCQKCGFKSSVRSVMLRHVKSCRKVYKCGSCGYATKRQSDLKRHMARKHRDSDDDAWT